MSLFHKCPEILQFPNNVDEFKYLNSKPYVLGNFVGNLWYEREKLLINMSTSM